MDGKTITSKAFSAEYYHNLYQIETDNFWFRYRARLILKAIEDHFPHTSNMLEIGCGTGFVLAQIHEKNSQTLLSGSDLFTEGLRFSRMRVPAASFYQIDACQIPFDSEFDLVLVLDVLEHIDRDSQALGEIFKSIRPGGGLIMTVPQHRWLWSRQDDEALHRRRYSRKELVDKMVLEGFKVTYITSFITLLLPVMILSRMFGRFTINRRRKYDPMRELKVNSIANRIMGEVCALEERILRRQVSFSAGGSLLCIGIREH